MNAPSNLIPGSIWERVKPNGEASYSRVLFVTNDGLPARVLEKHPQQVVFATDQGKVLSMDIADFCEKRTYFTYDADAAIQIEDLLLPQEEEDDLVAGEESIDSVVPDENLFTSNADQSEDLQEADDAQPGEDTKTSSLKINLGPHPLAAKLEANICGYNESPFHTGDTLHTVRFSLMHGLTMADIYSAFNLKDPNAIQKFEVTACDETFQVDVEAFVDVLLESGYISGNTGCLYIISEGNFRSHDEYPFDNPTAETVAVGSTDTVIDVSSNTEVVVS